jgi:hypothetical protein
MTAKQILFLIFITIVFNFSLNSISVTTTDTNTIEITKNDYMNNQATNSTSGNLKYFFVFLSLIPLLGGLWGINTWFTEYNMSKNSVNWEIIPGKIISKSTTTGLTSHLSTRTDVNSESTRAVCPKIEYVYKAGDQIYKSSKIDFSNRGCSTNSQDAEKLLARFPDVAEKIDVYYDRNNNITVLIPGTQDTNYWWLVMTSIFFVVGIIFIRLSLS